MKANPFVEISATSQNMEWVRLSGKAVFDSNLEVKRKAFELLPMLSNIYKGPEDPCFEVFCLKDVEVVFQSMGNFMQLPEKHRF